MEEPAGDLLTCTDLGEGPELLQIHIDLKRLLTRTECLLHLTPFSTDPLSHSPGKFSNRARSLNGPGACRTTAPYSKQNRVSFTDWLVADLRLPKGMLVGSSNCRRTRMFGGGWSPK